MCELIPSELGINARKKLAVKDFPRWSSIFSGEGIEAPEIMSPAGVGGGRDGIATDIANDEPKALESRTLSLRSFCSSQLSNADALRSINIVIKS